MKDVNLDALERLAEEKRGRASMSVTPRQILSLIAHIRELEQDAARYQHVRAHGMPKLCPAGFYYHDGVFYPTADAAIDATQQS